jgi:hypothetical protein
MKSRCVFLNLGLLALGIALGVSGVLLWQRWGEPVRSWEATVYLPVNDNRGKPFPPKEWRAAIGILVERFGGATLGGRREGFWLGARRRIQREPVRLLTVSFDRGRLDEFRQAVREVGKRLGQQTVYVRYEEPHVELIAGPE